MTCRAVKADVAKLVELTTQNFARGGYALERSQDGRLIGSQPRHRDAPWQADSLKPYLVRGFKVSRDSQFVEKLEDIMGLCMSPPEHALVLCCDDKGQVQALDRSQPGLSMKKGHAQLMTYDYKHHSTTTLFAALNVRDGQGQGAALHRRQLRHAKAPGGAGVAAHAPEVQDALHTNLGVVAELLHLDPKMPQTNF